MSLEETIKERVHDPGADFVGIAPRPRFVEAPEFGDPKHLLPGFRQTIPLFVLVLPEIVPDFPLFHNDPKFQERL